MKRVRYVGTEPVVLPMLNIEVTVGDEIEVPDSFENGLFEVVKPVMKPKGEAN